MTAEVVVIATPMTETEARQTLARARKSAEDTWIALAELHERSGWKALGYSSFRACIAEEFDFSRGHAYVLVDAGKFLKALREVSGNQTPRLTAGAAAEAQKLVGRGETVEAAYRTTTQPSTTPGASIAGVPGSLPGPPRLPEVVDVAASGLGEDEICDGCGKAIGSHTPDEEIACYPILPRYAEPVEAMRLCPDCGCSLDDWHRDNGCGQIEPGPTPTGALAGNLWTARVWAQHGVPFDRSTVEQVGPVVAKLLAEIDRLNALVDELTQPPEVAPDPPTVYADDAEVVHHNSRERCVQRILAAVDGLSPKEGAKFRRAHRITDMSSWLRARTDAELTGLLGRLEGGEDAA